jgi:hypothetical protein
MPNTTTELSAQIKTLATQSLLATLRRSASGTLKRGEAQTAALLLEAYRSWWETNEKSELAERAHEIIRLANAIGAKAAIHTARLKELIAIANPAPRRLPK